VIVIDADGVVLMASNAVKTLFGFDPEEIVGNTIELLVPSSSAPYMCVIGRALRPRVWRGRWPWPGADRTAS